MVQHDALRAIRLERTAPCAAHVFDRHRRIQSYRVGAEKKAQERRMFGLDIEVTEHEYGIFFGQTSHMVLELSKLTFSDSFVLRRREMNVDDP